MAVVCMDKTDTKFSVGSTMFCTEERIMSSIKKTCMGDYSDAPEAPVRIVGKHLFGLRDALRQHICGEAA